MYKVLKNIALGALLILPLALPVFAGAAGNTVGELATNIQKILSIVRNIFIGLILVWAIWIVLKNIIDNSGFSKLNEVARSVLWLVLVLVLIFPLFKLVAIGMNAFGLDTNTRVDLPDIPDPNAVHQN